MRDNLSGLSLRLWPRFVPLYTSLFCLLTAIMGCDASTSFSGGGNTSSNASDSGSTATGPLTITKGGSYSGTWTSDDPNVSAVSISTNEAVTLHDAVLTGRGDLIDINGTGSGANVIVKNVTGTALDPKVAGMQRGAFLKASDVAVLDVQHCSISGASYGIEVVSSTASKLKIAKNVGSDLEDRASDGAGGLLAIRPSLGHFIFLNGVSAPAGADVSWNELVNTIGESSTEDVINIFKSQGAKGTPIRVHDNYMEGYSSTTTASYTGSGLIADGDGNEPVTAFVHFNSNQMVHTAGSGLEIAVGHNIVARNNRVVSCGIDSAGNWFAMPFVNAVVVWNYYGAPDFGDITVEGTGGGVLRPSATDQPMIVDVWARTSDLNATDSINSNAFTDPCLQNGQLYLQAEDDERAAWAAKLAAASITPGDQHQP